MELRLKINQKFAKIGLKTTPPRTNIEQKPAEVKIKKIDGELKIDSKPVKIEIDQKKARAALDHKNYKIYGREIAKEGKKTAIEATKEYARQGDQLAKIEKGGKPLITQAKQNAYSGKKEIGLKWKPGPEYNVRDGQLDIAFEMKDIDGMELKLKPNWPQVNLQRGKVEVYQKQWPELEIRAVNQKV